MAKRTFEEAVLELEKVTLEIADEKTGIDQLLPLFEKGEKLRKECEELLNKVEIKLESYKIED